MRPLRRYLAPLALLCALPLAAATACSRKKDDDKPPAAEGDPSEAGDASDSKSKSSSSSVPAPDPDAEAGTVVATVQLPSGVALPDISAAVDTIKPGTSALLRMQVPTLLTQALGMDLAGANLTAPMSIVVLDPTNHPQPIALLVEAEDLDKLAANAKAGGKDIVARDGKALIGPADVVAGASAYAFDKLLTQPQASEIVIYPQPLMAAFRPQIDQSLAQMGTLMAQNGGAGVSEMISLYAKALTGMAEQTERIVIHVAGDASGADLLMRAEPVSGSALASFASAQTPAEHALLAKLPAGGGAPPGVLSGHFAAGDAKDALLRWSVELMTSMYDNELGSEDWTKLLDGWIATLDGTFAMAIDIDVAAGVPAMTMRGLLGSNDATAMRATWREMAATMAAASDGDSRMMGMKMVMKIDQDALKVEDVPVDLMTTKIDLSGMSPEQQAAMEAAGSGNQALHFAAFDQFGAMASADEDGSTMRSLVTSARGQTATLQPSAKLQQALGRSKQLGESLVYYIEFASFVPSGTPPVPFDAIVMGMGQDDGALQLRVAVVK